MKAKDFKDIDTPLIKKPFTAQSGAVYSTEEILFRLQDEHFLFDFKNNKQPFSEDDISDLLKNYPLVRVACERFYTDNKLIGLIIRVKNRDELFKEMRIFSKVLEELVQDYDGWGWIPDDVLSVQLSEPLDRFYKLIEHSNTKFLDFIILNDNVLNCFFNKGLNEHVKSISNGKCSSGFAMNFTHLLSQAQSAKCFIDYNLRQNEHESLIKFSHFPYQIKDSSIIQGNDQPSNSKPRKQI